MILTRGGQQLVYNFRSRTILSLFLPSQTTTIISIRIVMIIFFNIDYDSFCDNIYNRNIELWTELISMLLTSRGSRWCSQWCLVSRVVVSNTFLTLTNSTDVSAIIFPPIWVTEAPIALEAEEGTSSTIRAVVPIFLSRVEIAGRWSHRRGWSWWRGRRWSAASSPLTTL